MLEKTYNPKDVEDKLYRFWEDNKLFKPEQADPSAKSFSLVIPPPNVTGTLHIGHALDNTLQDIMTRWRRMQGRKTLWMPGTDHAGIATQNVVEKKLREQGVSKFDLGREEFLKQVWTWALARKSDIVGQFKRLGISPDWERQRFTLDDGLSKAVRTAFVTLYERKLIYRGTYIVNWCPRCASAISDIETEYEEEDSFLWEIRYPVKDSTDALIVATTRPETMYGDVAIAVHPEDERYKHLIGKTLVLPLANVEIPIIGDDYVDREFGTGALKITPAHDPNDFEIGRRHNLEPVWVIDESGNLKADPRVPTNLQGLDRFEVRAQTEALLREAGYLVNKIAHRHNVGHCQRCGTTIEALLSNQWFVRCTPLAEKSIAAVDAGELKFVPERWTKIYLDWMHNIRDWCISRQLWWGHQIPAWYCDACNEITVAIDDPTACAHCNSSQLRQETDVLDTWFSSGLWPFSTMGWPDTNASDFKTFYPTSVLVTGFDIIFFWVARMVMFGLELTDTVPFSDVYIHGLIRDEKGQKMSKSKGNTIDPVEIIDEYGCDAMRFSLTSLVTYGGQDIKLSKERFEQGKLFANKLWNASRFVLMNLEGVDDQPIDANQLSVMDHWMLETLDRARQEINEKLETYRFGEVADILYELIWNQFCDWYVEYAKKPLRDEASKANTQRILRDVMDQILRLLHPIMPFITEEIWQKLPNRSKISISISGYSDIALPSLDQAAFAISEELMETIRAVRNLRQSSGVLPHLKTPLIIEHANPVHLAALQANAPVFEHFLKLDGLDFTTQLTEPPANAISGISGEARLIISLAGTVDVAAERERQSKKRETIQKEFDQLNGRLSNAGFVEKAPAAVVEKDRARLDELRQQLETIDAQLSALVG